MLRPLGVLGVVTALAGCNLVFPYKTREADRGPLGDRGRVGDQSRAGDRRHAGDLPGVDPHKGDGPAREASVKDGFIFKPDGAVPCGICTFTSGVVTCAGTVQEVATPTPGSATPPDQRVFKATLQPPTASAGCNRLSIEVRIVDPGRPTEAAYNGAVLLDIADAPTCDGGGGGLGFSNDSELDIKYMDDWTNDGAAWHLDVYGSDYYLQDHGQNLVYDFPGAVATTGETKLRIDIANNSVVVSKLNGWSWSTVSTIAPPPLPTHPCSIFCLFQKDEEAGSAGDGDIWIALNRVVAWTTTDRFATGLTDATITVY